MTDEELKSIEETIFYSFKGDTYEFDHGPDRLVEAYRQLQAENVVLNKEAASLRLQVANNSSSALVDVHKQLDIANEEIERLLGIQRAMTRSAELYKNERDEARANSKTGFDTYVEERLNDPVFAAEFQAAQKQIKNEPVTVTIVQPAPNVETLWYIGELQNEIKKLQLEVLRAQKSEWHYQDQVFEIDKLLAGIKDPAENGCSFYCAAIGGVRRLLLQQREQDAKIARLELELKTAHEDLASALFTGE